MNPKKKRSLEEKVIEFVENWQSFTFAGQIRSLSHTCAHVGGVTNMPHKRNQCNEAGGGGEGGVRGKNGIIFASTPHPPKKGGKSEPRVHCIFMID